MAESENKRTRRTPQERAAEVDEKIAKIDQSIKELESKKESVVAEYDAARLYLSRNAQRDLGRGEIFPVQTVHVPLNGVQPHRLRRLH